ncbi:hypothetical protein [Streptomyces beihaiensis]|uniref:Uncharacterized protein n=1 Tax=Streptomyces beihaiensis TaxID=2984495 RepID=A0ABT3TX58_9ACTN|nr:hypothetical protein [Streptomyces beihaiensis]MCX3061631.1 hypothetical protein [Streptomyces beihaiensis]
MNRGPRDDRSGQPGVGHRSLTTTLSRWAAAAGAFLIGYGIHATGSLALPLSLTAVVFLLGIALIRTAPETRDQELPA